MSWICPRCGTVHSDLSYQCACPPNFVTASNTGGESNVRKLVNLLDDAAAEEKGMSLDEQRHRAIIRGLQIFAEAKKWGVCAMHDKILAGPEGPSAEGTGGLLDVQIEELKALGWFSDIESWGFFT